MEKPEKYADTVDYDFQGILHSTEESLAYMYKYSISTDVILYAQKDNEPSVGFSAHKLVLACRSPMFADMFYNKSINTSIIVFDDIQPRALDIVLWYIYNDSLEDANICELIEAFKVAKRCEIYSFCDICAEKFIEFSSDINTSTACSVLHIANFTKCKKLRQKCMKLIINEPEKVLSTEEFLLLDKETVWVILQNLRSDVCHKIIMKCVINWMQQNNESDRKYLSLIDLSDFSLEDFLHIVEEFPNFFTGKEVSCTLSKLLKPESEECPQWCKFSEVKTTSQILSLYEGMELIKEESQHIRTDCDKKFPKSSLFSLPREFYHEVLLRVSVSNRTSSLVMLELAFGSEYIPLNNLTIDLLCNFGKKMQFVKYLMIPCRRHYYLLLPSSLMQQANKTFKLLLRVRAKDLDTWGIDGPVSSDRYRIACVTGTINTVSTCPFLTVQIKPYEEWLLFVDPHNGEKKCIITTFYFDTVENFEKYMRQLKIL